MQSVLEWTMEIHSCNNCSLSVAIHMWDVKVGHTCSLSKIVAQMVKQNISQAIPHPQIISDAFTKESLLEVKTIMKNRAFHTTVFT